MQLRRRTRSSRRKSPVLSGAMVEKSHAEKEDQSDRAAGQRWDYREKRAGHGGEEWPSGRKVEEKKSDYNYYRSPQECKFYQRGHCDRHDACKFDHKLPGFADVGVILDPSILPLRLCKLQRLPTGCKHGSECSFVHVPEGICKLFMCGPDACNNKRYSGGCSGGTHTQITMKEMHNKKMQMQSNNDDTLQMMEGVVKKNEEKKRRPRKDRSRSRRSLTPIRRKKKKNYDDSSVTLRANLKTEERRKPNRLSFT